MDTSPIRELAEAYAQGKISLEDYRQQRRRLLDAIEDGEIKRSKVAPTDPSTQATREPTNAHGIPRITLVTKAMGGILLLALLIWILAPKAALERTPDLETALPEANHGAQEQQLLEQFLSINHWDNATLDDFEHHWQRLPKPDRLMARTQPWFQGMKNALSQELNARKALTALSASGESQAAISRLISFGTMLGIEDLEPVFPTLQEVPLETSTKLLPPSQEGITPGEDSTLNGARWLKSQTNEHFSLQLFAVNRLRKVESLIARFPELKLKLVPLEQANPRFRLLYGIFPNREAAQIAHSTLPEALRLKQPNPVIKTVQELKAGLE